MFDKDKKYHRIADSSYPENDPHSGVWKEGEDPKIGFTSGPKPNLLDLHPVELAYFKAICRNPGCKYPMYSESEKGNPTQYTIDDGTEYGDIRQGWQKLEELGLVEAVGSYKWIPKITYEELLEQRIEELESIIKDLNSLYKDRVSQ